jgi:hypothetical protein
MRSQSRSYEKTNNETKNATFLTFPFTHCKEGQRKSKTALIQSPGREEDPRSRGADTWRHSVYRTVPQTSGFGGTTCPSERKGCPTDSHNIEPMYFFIFPYFAACKQQHSLYPDFKLRVAYRTSWSIYQLACTTEVGLQLAKRGRSRRLHVIRTITTVCFSAFEVFFKITFYRSHGSLEARRWSEVPEVWSLETALLSCALLPSLRQSQNQFVHMSKIQILITG